MSSWIAVILWQFVTSAWVKNVYNLGLCAKFGALNPKNFHQIARSAVLL